MSLLDDRRRLAQARRITMLKERRSERARREAVQAERAAATRGDAARRRAEAAAQVSGEARAAFFAQPADPHAETWMIVMAERGQRAAQDRNIAVEQHDTARAEAAAARCAHERLLERAALIEAKAQTLGQVVAARAQDREDQEMEDRRR